MESRRGWLDAGLAALAEDGGGALRIDRLAARLGLSKGSFYHHFPGISAYRLDLLGHYEATSTTQHIESVEAQTGLAPREKLAALQVAVLADEDDSSDLEVAMRAWAAQDDDARAMLERVDAKRIAYLQGLLQEITGDADEAIALSRLIYLVLIGAYHVVPALKSDDVARLYAHILRPLDEKAHR